MIQEILFFVINLKKKFHIDPIISRVSFSREKPWFLEKKLENSWILENNYAIYDETDSSLLEEIFFHQKYVPDNEIVTL